MQKVEKIEKTNNKQEAASFENLITIPYPLSPIP